MMHRIFQKIDSWLYTQKFVSLAVRQLLAVQIMVTVSTFIIALVTLYYTVWPLAFCIGAAISAGAFWQLARFVENNIYRKFSAALGLKLFAGFNLRLLLALCVFFVLIGWLKIPVLPLLAGLTTTVASIVGWGCLKLVR